jgi:hypothetical protein
MPKKTKGKELTEKSINDSLYVICLAVTVVAVVTTLVRFFSRGAYPPDEINFFYLGVLALYSLHKEALHWLTEEADGQRQRKGEYFVYLWLIVAMTLYCINFFSKDFYGVADDGRELHALRDTAFIAIEVSGVFVISRFLKIFRLATPKRRKAVSR